MITSDCADSPTSKTKWFGVPFIEAVSARLKRFSGLDLAKKFALAAIVGTGITMAVLSWWVENQIERGIVYHTASSVALHLDEHFQSDVQSLTAGGAAKAAAIESLGSSKSWKDDRRGLLGLTVWARGNEVLFSSGPESSIVPSSEVTQAWNNTVEGRLDIGSRGAAIRSDVASKPILRVFAPMHDPTENTVVAVLEVALAADDLAADVSQKRWKTAGIAGLLTMGLSWLLFRLVRQAGQTIRSQDSDLVARLEAMRILLNDNQELKQRVIEATHRTHETNDRALRRIGAELHDGPVQLIALSLLRLETLRQPLVEGGKSDLAEETQTIENLLRDCLKEVRQMSSGLALPNLHGAPVRKALELAILNHERRTKTRVERQLDPDLPGPVSSQLSMFLYRFVQEGLNNAHKHAGGQGQAVSAQLVGNTLVVSVNDRGPGFAPTTDALDNTELHGLGLAGIRDRIETFGGTLEILPRDGGGASLVARINLDRASVHDG